MHIEPGVVDGAKLVLSVGTAAVSFALAGKMAADTIRESNVSSTLLRSAVTSGLVFCFFQVLPHHPVGVSEVHLILGSTLLLMFGAGPAAVGLALGLLLQGLFFVPSDLPQYGMNVTTLLVPLYGINLLAQRIVAPATAYIDLSYGQALALSTAFQGGIVLWVAFWAIYGHGFAASNLAEVAKFGAAYMSVVTIEPLIDLGLLALAKVMHRASSGPMFQARLHRSACGIRESAHGSA